MSPPIRLLLGDQVYVGQRIYFKPDLEDNKSKYLITGYVGPHKGRDGADGPYKIRGGAVGEIVKHYSRPDQPRKPIRDFTTLDSAVRQSMRIIVSSTERGQELSAENLALTNIASYVLAEWRDMPQDQREAIEATLGALNEKLERARNPHLVHASEHLSPVIQLKDRLGRDNPLIVKSRTEAAIRDLSYERAQHELVLAASLKRQTVVMELASVVSSTVGLILGRLINYGVTVEELVPMLDSVAIKPYYFAVKFTKEVLTEQGITSKAIRMITQAFEFEADLIVISDLLSISRDSGQDLYPLIGRAGLKMLTFEPYLNLGYNLSQILDALVRLGDGGNPKMAEKIINQFKHEMRYRITW